MAYPADDFGDATLVLPHQIKKTQLFVAFHDGVNPSQVAVFRFVSQPNDPLTRGIVKLEDFREGAVEIVSDLMRRFDTCDDPTYLATMLDTRTDKIIDLLADKRISIFQIDAIFNGIRSQMADICGTVPPSSGGGLAAPGLD